MSRPAIAQHPRCRVRALLAFAAAMVFGLIAGPGAVACGFAQLDGPAGGVADCADLFNLEERPFWAVVRLTGVHSVVKEGFVRTPEGELVHLWYDSDRGASGRLCSATLTR